MAEIAARWEWRSFGQRFGRAEALLDTLTPNGIQDSDEIYLLSVTRGNVKIRDALMDIKVLREVNADGLEQWIPVMKAEFPLSANDTVKVLEALGAEIAGNLPDKCTLDDLLEQFVAPGNGVRVVKVHKRRVRYLIEGCTSEFSDVVADGKPIRTIAVESVDAAAVIRAVTALGLLGYVNTSYPRGLAALIDDEPEHYAVIDVGTNSVKFHLAERKIEGNWSAIIDHAEITRLGEGLADNGVISDTATERTISVIASMADEAKRSGVRAIAAVGTAGLRVARNGNDVVARIREGAGVAVEVISAEEEARLAYLATKAGLALKKGSLVVFDTGGGSSQFTFGNDSEVAERFSVEVGAARYTERFQLDHIVTAEALHEAMAAISADLTMLDGRPVPDMLVAMGGAVTNIAAVKHGLATYDPTVIQGTVLDRSEIERQIDIYRTRDANGRRSIIGLQPKRAEVILAGACIVRTIMEKLGKSSVTVSDRGLRHGVLVERFAL